MTTTQPAEEARSPFVFDDQGRPRCTTHLIRGELPDGGLITKPSKHVVTVIDGVIRNTHDPSRAAEKWSINALRRLPFMVKLNQ